MNGAYSSMMSALNSQLSSSATQSTIASGQNQLMSGTNSQIGFGTGNTINGVIDSGAFGSAITINHNQCIILNDGNFAVNSGAAATFVFQAANGIAIGTWGNTPTRDVCIGKKVAFSAVNIAVNFNTAGTPAVIYNVSTAGGNRTMTLSSSDNVGGNLFYVALTSAANALTISPATGTINGAPSLILIGIGTPVMIWSDGANWHALRGA